MSLSIGASMAAQSFALDYEASSRVLYNGHAGLGGDLVGRPPDASRHEQSLDTRESVSQWYPPETDDEVLVSFAQVNRIGRLSSLRFGTPTPRLRRTTLSEVKYPERLATGEVHLTA